MQRQQCSECGITTSSHTTPAAATTWCSPIGGGARGEERTVPACPACAPQALLAPYGVRVPPQLCTCPEPARSVLRSSASAPSVHLPRPLPIVPPCTLWPYCRGSIRRLHSSAHGRAVCTGARTILGPGSPTCSCSGVCGPPFRFLPCCCCCGGGLSPAPPSPCGAACWGLAAAPPACTHQQHTHTINRHAILAARTAARHAHQARTPPGPSGLGLGPTVVGSPNAGGGRVLGLALPRVMGRRSGGGSGGSRPSRGRASVHACVAPPRPRRRCRRRLGGDPPQRQAGWRRRGRPSGCGAGCRYDGEQTPSNAGPYPSCRCCCWPPAGGAGGGGEAWDRAAPA